MAVLLVTLAAAVAVVLITGLVLVGMFFNLWLNAKAAGIPLSIPHLAMMRLRRIDPARVLDAVIRLSKAGDATEIEALEAHVLAGGHLEPVVEALIAAQKAGLSVDFRTVAAIDLAGRDVVDAVQARVNPKVIVVPPPGSPANGVSGVARDGIRLAARARVTVRTRLDRMVGGAGEDTIVARVGEGIVAAIGRAAGHREILEKPDLISACLLRKGLDAGTCYEVLSVDIADVDVLDNVAARLKSSQAEADKRIAQARAETRRAAAVAAHQEMKARTVDSSGQVTLARATVPLAIASALDDANLGSGRPLAPVLGHRLRWRQAR
jgi:uncharacterized protein YqfA (UPF0365 family)